MAILSGKEFVSIVGIHQLGGDRMIKVVEIEKHGDNEEFVKLSDELIKCPECPEVGFHRSYYEIEPNFNALKKLSDGTFELACAQCGCIFIVEVEDETRG